MTKKIEIDVASSVLPTVEIPHLSKSAKELANKKLIDLMKEEGKIVRGTFQCFENPGATQKITYKKYPTPAEMRKRGSEGGLEPFSKTMTDGQAYEIPLYVARFLNGTDVSVGAMDPQHNTNHQIGTCSYSIHGFKYQGEKPGESQLGNDGIPVPIVGVTKRVKRYGFQSMEFAAAG